MYDFDKVWQNEESSRVDGMSGLIDFRDFILSHRSRDGTVCQVVDEITSYMPSLSMVDALVLIRVFCPGYPGLAFAEAMAQGGR